MNPIDRVVNSTETQLQETLFELADALRLRQHSRALGHLTDSHLIFSTGLRELTDLIAHDEPEDIALELADEKLSKASSILNGMSDIVSHYIDEAVKRANDAEEMVNLTMRIIDPHQDFQQNPFTW